MLVLIIHMDITLCWWHTPLFSFDEIVEIAIKDIKVETLDRLVEPPFLCVAVEGAVRVKNMLLSKSFEDFDLLVGHKVVSLELLFDLAFCFSC